MKNVEKSSGNVFADTGHPDPEAALAKAEIARRISMAIARKGLTQTKAAAMLGIDQARLSDISRGRLGKYSTDYLFRIVRALGQDVEIRIKRKPKSRAQARISVLGA